MAHGGTLGHAWACLWGLGECTGGLGIGEVHAKIAPSSSASASHAPLAAPEPSSIFSEASSGRSGSDICGDEF